MFTTALHNNLTAPLKPEGNLNEDENTTTAKGQKYLAEEPRN